MKKLVAVWIFLTIILNGCSGGGSSGGRENSCWGPVAGDLAYDCGWAASPSEIEQRAYAAFPDEGQWLEDVFAEVLPEARVLVYDGRDDVAIEWALKKGHCVAVSIVRGDVLHYIMLESLIEADQVYDVTILKRNEEET